MKKISLSIIAMLLGSVISDAQSIPNSGFENWSNPNGYNIPDSWTSLNDMTSTAGIYTCVKGTPGNPGTSYLKLTSKTLSGMGVMPGIAVSGVLDESTFSPVSGFAYTQRPTAFTGTWQYMGASANDVGSIMVYLTKWDNSMNMRDTVGYLMHELNGMIMSWANFSFPLTYLNSSIPDTCVIILNASGPNPQPSSYLYVDNLDFVVSTTGVDKLNFINKFSIYPNPAQECITLDLRTITSAFEKIEIVDMKGAVVYTFKPDKSLTPVLSIDHLSSGDFIIRIITNEGVLTNKFHKQ